MHFKIVWQRITQGRIQVYFFGVSIWSNYRTESTYSDRQAWANSAEPDQTQPNAASDQGLHCLPLTQQFKTHSQVQWAIATTRAFVPKDVSIKMNLLLYRILNEQGPVVQS